MKKQNPMYQFMDEVTDFLDKLQVKVETGKDVKMIQILNDIPKYGRERYEAGMQAVIDKLILAECEEPEEGKSSRKKFYHLSIEDYKKLLDL